MYRVTAAEGGRAADSGERERAVARLGSALQRHGRFTHALKQRTSGWMPEGVELGAYGLLAHLVSGGPRKQGELAQCAALDPSTVSRHVSQLVRAGLVRRRPHPEDGRAVQLAVTDQALELHRDVAGRFRGMLADVVHTWEPADVTQLAELIDRLCDGIEARYFPGVHHARTDPAAEHPSDGQTSPRRTTA